MTKTNSGLVEYCKAQVGKPYWYGCFGQIADQNLLNMKRKQYGAYYGYSDFKGQFGKRVHDCIGLVKGYLWSDTPTSVPKYNSEQDLGATGMYNYGCSKKGNIGSFDYVPGRLLFKRSTTSDGMSHVGVYVGKNDSGEDMVIEAKGHLYGVVRSKMDSKWTNWGQCKYIIEDTQASTETPQKPSQSATGHYIVSVSDFLALRTGPGTQYEKKGELYNGALVSIIETQGNWVKVTGGLWCCKTYLRVPS